MVNVYCGNCWLRKKHTEMPIQRGLVFVTEVFVCFCTSRWLGDIPFELSAPVPSTSVRHHTLHNI